MLQLGVCGEPQVIVGGHQDDPTPLDGDNRPWLRIDQLQPAKQVLLFQLAKSLLEHASLLGCLS